MTMAIRLSTATVLHSDARAPLLPRGAWAIGCGRTVFSAGQLNRGPGRRGKKCGNQDDKSSLGVFHVNPPDNLSCQLSFDYSKQFSRVQGGKRALRRVYAATEANRPTLLALSEFVFSAQPAHMRGTPPCAASEHRGVGGVGCHVGAAAHQGFHTSRVQGRKRDQPRGGRPLRSRRTLRTFYDMAVAW